MFFADLRSQRVIYNSDFCYDTDQLVSPNILVFFFLSFLGFFTSSGTLQIVKPEKFFFREVEQPKMEQFAPDIVLKDFEYKCKQLYF